jgi:hypothetical protein
MPHRPRARRAARCLQSVITGLPQPAQPTLAHMATQAPHARGPLSPMSAGRTVAAGQRPVAGMSCCCRQTRAVLRRRQPRAAAPCACRASECQHGRHARLCAAPMFEDNGFNRTRPGCPRPPAVLPQPQTDLSRRYASHSAHGTSASASAHSLSSMRRTVVVRRRRSSGWRRSRCFSNLCASRSHCVSTSQWPR